MEGTPATHLLNLFGPELRAFYSQCRPEMISSLQSAHDGKLRKYAGLIGTPAERFEQSMAKIATDYGLVYTPITPKEST
jgi:hypothetical protein